MLYTVSSTTDDMIRYDGADGPEADGNSWKEIASRMKGMKAGDTVQKMVTRMNELWPFSEANGIFDNGCGSGTIISYILDTYGSNIPESASLIAGDFSDHMLDVLGKTQQDRMLQQGGVWNRLEVRKIDAHDLSTISDGSLSHVTGGHLYFLLEDARTALNETLRVLSPGGVLAMTTGKGSQHIDALCDAVEKVRPGTQLKLLREPWNSEDALKQELETIGFVDAETFLVASDMKYENHQDYADMLLVMPVMKNVFGDYDEGEKVRLREQLVENLRGMNPAAPGSLKGTSIVTLARKERG